jgi:hypothetical protein
MAIARRSGLMASSKEVKQMPTKPAKTRVRAGDWIETRGVHGQATRRGEIIEVLGRDGHEHYRVRWDEQHESIVYPADGVIIVPRN